MGREVLHTSGRKGLDSMRECGGHRAPSQLRAASASQPAAAATVKLFHCVERKQAQWLRLLPNGGMR